MSRKLSTRGAWPIGSGGRVMPNSSVSSAKLIKCTYSILHLELLKQDVYKETTCSKDKQAVAKQFWSYVKSKRRFATGDAHLRNDDVPVSDAKGKANTLI